MTKEGKNPFYNTFFLKKIEQIYRAKVKNLMMALIQGYALKKIDAKVIH